MATRNRRAERFARYDSADYLKTQEDVAEYLVGAFEDGGDDAAYMAHVIGIAARAHGGMTQLAKKTGMTGAGPYKALSKDGNPAMTRTLNVKPAQLSRERRKRIERRASVLVAKEVSLRKLRRSSARGLVSPAGRGLG